MFQKTKTISTRQLAILVFIISLSVKLFSLPILMLQSGGRVAWLPLVVFIIVDILILGALIAVSRLRPNSTAFETMQAVLGKVLSRVVFAIVLIGLIFRALSLMFNIVDFFRFDLFDGVPQWILLLPVALLMIAFGARSLRTLGRTGEVLIFLIVPALVILLVFMAKIANPVQLLPLLNNGDSPDLARTFLSFAFFFGDISAIFIAVGKIDPLRKTQSADVSKTDGHNQLLNPENAETVNKGFHPLAIFSCVIGAIFTIGYGLMLFSSYMPVRHIISPNSVSFVTHTAVSRFAFGRFDKILFVILSSCMLITLGVVTHAANRTIKFIVPKFKLSVIALVLALGLYITAVFLNTNSFFDFVKDFGIYIVSITSGGFILLLLICAIIKRERKYDSHEKN